MPSPTPTGNFLVLYGHGALTDETFDFRRAANARINLYSWTHKEVPVWDTQIQRAADDAIASGTIRASYATVNTSRIGGAVLNDYVIGPPDGVRLPTIPAGYNRTAIAALNATVHHNGATIAASTCLVLMIDADNPPVFFSDIISNPAFSAMPLDILWCACKSKLT